MADGFGTNFLYNVVEKITRRVVACFVSEIDADQFAKTNENYKVEKCQFRKAN